MNNILIFRHFRIGRVFAKMCISIFLILIVAECTQSKDITNLKIFDKVIDRKLVSSGFENEIVFSFKIRNEEDLRIYSIECQFPRKNSKEHYTCLIGVAHAGILLDPEEYKQRYIDFKKEYSNRGEKYLLFNFPTIGKRAQRDSHFFGPDGAGFGLTFTTSDGKFDVKIIVSNLLPSEIVDPNFNVAKTAQKISAIYDKMKN